MKFILVMLTSVTSLSLGSMTAFSFETSPYTSSPIISSAGQNGECRKGAECQFSGACVPKNGQCYNCIQGLQYNDAIGCFSCVSGTSLKNKNGKYVCSD